MIQIHRARIAKDIVAEFAIPKNTNSPKVAIIATGMPSVPSKGALIQFLATQGYFVIHPRYRGTWESDGQFLQNEPTQDIKDTIEEITTKKALFSLWDEKAYQFPHSPEFYIFAGSFGGPAGLLLSTETTVKAVIAVAPVIDWSMDSEAEPLPWLYELTKKAYGNGFRMTKKHWDTLGTTSFYDPAQQPEKIDGRKILIFQAQNDPSVPIEPLSPFAKKHHIKTHIKKSGGHLSLSAIPTAFYWTRIQDFLYHLQ